MMRSDIGKHETIMAVLRRKTLRSVSVKCASEVCQVCDATTETRASGVMQSRYERDVGPALPRATV